MNLISDIAWGSFIGNTVLPYLSFFLIGAIFMAIGGLFGFIKDLFSKKR